MKLTSTGQPGILSIMASAEHPGGTVHPAHAAELRVAHDGDLSDLLAAAEAFYQEDGFMTDPDQLHRNLEVLIKSAAARVTIALHESQLIGFAITTTSFGLENGLIAELEDLYVEPGSRQQGLAGRLINDACAWARDLGAAQLEVVTAPNGTDITHLNAYYEARGFINHGRQLRSRPLR